MQPANRRHPELVERAFKRKVTASPFTRDIRVEIPYDLTRGHEQKLKTTSNPGSKATILPNVTAQGEDQSEKEVCLEENGIKNSDQNGPEGQFRTVSSTTCDAGFPLWRAVFVISASPNQGL